MMEQIPTSTLKRRCQDLAIMILLALKFCHPILSHQFIIFAYLQAVLTRSNRVK